MYGRFGTCSYTCIFSGSGSTAIHDCHMQIPSFFVSIFTVQSYCHVSVLALCTGVPWRARPEAVLSLNMSNFRAQQLLKTCCRLPVLGLGSTVHQGRSHNDFGSGHAVSGQWHTTVVYSNTEICTTRVLEY